MKSDGLTPVAIIGGGFSGTIAAAQLARRGIACALIDSGPAAGAGIAYSTDEPAHLLNVRAQMMSAWPDDPDHFARFAAAQGIDSSAFAERRLFGRYVQQILADAVASGLVRVLTDRALSAQPAVEGWAVALESGTRLECRRLVLAIGNQEPDTLPFVPAGAQRFIANPWGGQAKFALDQAAATDAPLFILGTGLTMVDAVLSLDSAGHRGRIVALSRRGLLPRGHSETAAAVVERSEIPHGDLRGLWRWLRERSAHLGWRQAVDSLRPHSHALWQSLTPQQQQRFLRHARPWWDVHRHRIAPEVADRIRELVADGRLDVVAGKVTEFTEEGGAAVIRYRRRGEVEEREERAAFVLNCTGPLGDIRRTRDPLVRQLLADGLVRADGLGIGLEVDDRARIAGADGLWALGPLTKGRYWEIIAVPDIRIQAAEVAEDIAKELA